MKALRLIGRLPAALGFAALVLGVDGAFAATHMFKCIVAGRTIYQQQACPANADPASAPAAGAASAPAKETRAPAAVPAPRRLRPASRSASAVPATRR